MDNSVIAKSGWLYRKGTNGWEKNWVELYRDGYLKYYENDECPNADDVIFMPTECIAIKTGSQVDVVMKPPENHSLQCIFTVSATGNKLWIFCGECLDDMRAWQLALEQSRLIIVRNTFPTHNLMASHLNRHQMSQIASYSPFNLSSNYASAFTDGSLTYAPLPNRTLPTSSVPISFPNYSNPYLSANNASNFALSYPHPLPNFYSQPSPIPPPTPYPRPDGRDLAMGMLAGAAVGTLMWGPYLWW